VRSSIHTDHRITIPSRGESVRSINDENVSDDVE
jgi:hypothetical protein